MVTRVVFVPVSSSRGRGEYVRCLTLAHSLVEAAPFVQPHFLLSGEAPYRESCPFPSTVLPRSPTLSGESTTRALLAQRPDIVVFDNAGRTAHIRAAAASGAAVVYISSRTRQRRKAFRLHWMRYLSEHWIAQPRFRATDLTLMERLKLRCVPAPPRVRYLDAILPNREGVALRGFWDPQRLGPRVLVVPGGGVAHPTAPEAMWIYGQTAEQLAAAGHRVVQVGGMMPAKPNATSLRALEVVPPATLRMLMEEADLVVTNGGDTLLQALALQKPCVAAALAHDQAARLKMLASGVCVTPVAADSLTEAAAALLADRNARRSLQQAASRLAIRDRSRIARTTLLRLMERPLQPAPRPTQASLTR